MPLNNFATDDHAVQTDLVIGSALLGVEIYKYISFKREFLWYGGKKLEGYVREGDALLSSHATAVFQASFKNAIWSWPFGITT